MRTRGQGVHEIPPEVVAAIAIAVGAYLERPPEILAFSVRGPYPSTRTDAGAYHLAGRLAGATSRRRGGRA